MLGVEAAGPLHELPGVRCNALGVEVAAPEVLGAHPVPARGFPPKARRLDRAGDATPHHRVVEAEAPQNLRHLCDVAEHVGQIADIHQRAELFSATDPTTQIADVGFARHQKLVGLCVPRPHREPPLPREIEQDRFSLWADF